MGGEDEAMAVADANADADADGSAPDDLASDVANELEADTPVFAVKQRSKHITLAMLVSKGCDASNEHDEEVRQGAGAGRERKRVGFELGWTARPCAALRGAALRCALWRVRLTVLPPLPHIR